MLGSTSRCLAASRRFAASLNRCSNRVAPAGCAPRDGRLLMLGEKVRSLSLAAASSSRFWRALMPCLYRRSKRDPSAWWQQQAGRQAGRHRCTQVSTGMPRWPGPCRHTYSGLGSGAALVDVRLEGVLLVRLCASRLHALIALLRVAEQPLTSLQERHPSHTRHYRSHTACAQKGFPPWLARPGCYCGAYCFDEPPHAHCRTSQGGHQAQRVAPVLQPHQRWRAAS